MLGITRICCRDWGGKKENVNTSFLFSLHVSFVSRDTRVCLCWYDRRATRLRWAGSVCWYFPHPTTEPLTNAELLLSTGTRLKMRSLPPPPRHLQYMRLVVAKQHFTSYPKVHAMLRDMEALYTHISNVRDERKDPPCCNFFFFFPSALGRYTPIADDNDFGVFIPCSSCRCRRRCRCYRRCHLCLT